MSVPTLALLLISVTVGWTLLNRRIYNDGFSPFNVLLYSWILPLLMHTAHLSDLETPWRPHSVFLVTWVTAVLTAVSLLPAVLLKRGAPAAEREDVNRIVELAGARSTFWVIVLIFIPVFVAYIYSEFVTNPAGIPLLSALRGENLDADFHRWGKNTRWAAVTPLLFVLAPVAYLAFRATRARGRRFVLLLLALAYPIGGALKLSRSDIFIATVSVLVAHHYYGRWRAPATAAWRRALAYGTLLVASLFMYYAVLAVRVGGTGGALYADFIGFRWRSEEPAGQLAAVVYGYAALPFENLHRLLDTPNIEPHVGVGLLRPLYAVTGLGGVADSIDARIPYPDLASGAAASATFLTNVFAGGGMLGIAVAPALYALIVNLTYLALRRRPSWTALLLYVNFIYPWTWLYFNNAFSVLTFYLNAGFAVLFVALLHDVAVSTRHAWRLRPV
jgi:oligosaccharide repeat unit polymerase